MEDGEHHFPTRFFDELELLVHHLPVDETLYDLHADAAIAAVKLSDSEAQNPSHGNTNTQTTNEDALIDSPAATSTPAKRPSNPSRERKKSELLDMRDQVEKLELQRTLLHLKRKRHTEKNGSTVAIDWKKAAETERITRQLAEQEHARLISVLNQQLSLSEDLSSLVRQRYELESNDNDDNATRPKRFQSEASLGMLHAQFLHDIRRVYASSIERFFVGNAWTSANTELGLSMIREASADSPMEEMRDTRHLPFKYERVVEAAWRCSLHPFTEQGRVIEAYGSEDDQIALKYKALTPRMADRGDLLTAVMVVKRFIESDRTIHVWRSMLSANEEQVDADQRAYSDETGWIAIERVPESVPGFEEGTAVVRIVAQLTPLWPSTQTDQRLMNAATTTSGLNHSQKKLQPQDFLELVVDATHDDLVALTGAIESMLLDESA